MAKDLKVMNPVEDFISKSASLHLSLCAVADSVFAMGRNSGAKRSVLLVASRRPFLLLDDLIAIFASAANDPQYQTLVPDLATMGLIRTELQQGKKAIALTESGREKVNQIVKYESMLASLLPNDLTIADINRAIRCIELMQETMEQIQSSKQTTPNNIAG